MIATTAWHFWIPAYAGKTGVIFKNGNVNILHLVEVMELLELLQQAAPTLLRGVEYTLEAVLK